MTCEEIREGLRANLETKLREFGLPHWRVETHYVRLEKHEDGFQGCLQVKKRWEYERATIEVDLDACSDAYESIEDFEAGIEHELMHIAHSPFDLVYNIVWEMLDDDQRSVLKESWRQAQELTVRNLERMAYGIRRAANENPPVLAPSPSEVPATNGQTEAKPETLVKA